MADLIAAAVTTWLTTWLLHSTVLLGAAWLASRALGARAAALRTHLWRAALVGALVTATAQSSGFVTRLPQSDLDLRSMTRSAGVAPEAAPAATIVPGAIAPRAPVAAPSHSATQRDAVAPRAVVDGPLAALARWLARHWAQVLLSIWLAGAVFGLFRIVVLGWLARRELADRVAAPATLRDELARLAAAHGMSAPRLTVCAALGGPVSLPNGEIVVPEWCLALAPRQRAALLAHELAHQRHADPQWLSAALLLHSLLWLQPLLGVARRELAALAELEADAWAARAVDDPRALAECLARCAEHLVADRAALFGAAMADAGAGRSPLMERIERLLEGVHMKVKETPVTARVGVVLALVAGVFLLPGLVFGERDAFGFGGNSIHISSDDDDVTVSITRDGYQAKFQADGKFALDEAESDVVSLAAGGSFRLMEKSGGVKHEYEVVADKAGALVRTYWRDGKKMPIDAAGKQWLATALPKLLRETGFDAEARVARLLKKGGAAAVFAEIDQIEGDYSRASYLGALLAKAKLEPADLDHALDLARRIGSDYEKRRALSAALDGQRVGAAQLSMLLKAGATIGSDYERAELLVAAAPHLDGDAAARDAWLAAAAGIDSDYEMRRALEAALTAQGKDRAVIAGALGIAGKQLGSDFELRSLLTATAAGVDGDRALTAAYLAATTAIDSDFERREALCALLDAARFDANKLDAAALDGVMAATVGMGSDFERLQVLEKLAPLVAGDAQLAKRFRDLSRGLADYERGQALKALDDASAL